MLHIILLFVLSFSQYDNAVDFFQDVHALVDRFTGPQGVDYQALTQNPELLDSIEYAIASVNLETMDTYTKKAFLINAYNMLVIAKVTEIYPVENVMEVDDFFTDEDFIVSGRPFSLDQLEAYIFEIFPDERIHFALVCAAVNCPALDTFTPKNVDFSLNLLRTSFINSEKAVRKIEGKYYISELFRWYQNDFIKDNSTSIHNYLNYFLYEPIVSDSEPRYFKYDWTLNDTAKVE